MHHKVADGSGKPSSFALLVSGCHRCVATGIQVSQLLPYRVGNSVGNYHVYVLPQNRLVSPSLPTRGAAFLRSYRGRIYLILGGPTINQLANEIFQDYQNQAVSGELQFRRWPLRSVRAVTNSVKSRLTREPVASMPRRATHELLLPE